jgi:hypothetical protein
MFARFWSGDFKEFEFKKVWDNIKIDLKEIS